MPGRKSREPRKIPTQARARATWTAILDAAAQVLVNQGYERATTDRIAERAGVSIGTLYEYFPNKEAVFATLSLRWNDQRWEMFQQEVAKNRGNTLDSVIRGTIRARIAATRLDSRLNTALRRDVPAAVTEQQAETILEEFIEPSVQALEAFAMLGPRDRRLVAEVMIHATHAVIDNMAETHPDLLDSPALEEELTLMMCRYVSRP